MLVALTELIQKSHCSRMIWTMRQLFVFRAPLDRSYHSSIVLHFTPRIVWRIRIANAQDAQKFKGGTNEKVQ